MLGSGVDYILMHLNKIQIKDEASELESEFFNGLNPNRLSGLSWRVVFVRSYRGKRFTGSSACIELTKESFRLKNS